MAAICRSRSKKQMAPASLQRAPSTVPVLQREGHTRFALTAGEYRSGNSQQETPDFFRGTAMHGLPAGWTLYGGTQLADRYRAFNLGVGKNMGYFGALSLDITQANATTADDSEHQGQSVRFLYNKSTDETGTNLQLVGYRYSTRGYYNFADTTYRRMSGYSVETRDGVIRKTEIYRLLQSGLQQARQGAAERDSAVGAHRHPLSQR